MPAALHRRRPALLASMAVIALSLALAACGGGGGQGQAASAPATPAMGPTAFPKPGAMTLAELRRGLGPGPVLAPAVSLLEPGRNRFGFALFDRGRRQIAQAPAALYVAPASGGRVEGPFPTRYESLDVAPRFRSRTVASDPDAAASLYTASLPFRRPGKYAVLAMVRLDERLVAADPIPVSVTAHGPVPDVGQLAPRTPTPTAQSVGGDLAKIDTRIPPDDMHRVNFVDALGKRPILLLFATPQLCQSRVCGPVVDIAEQVKHTHPGDTAFIHMEIYRHNKLEDGFRPQVRAWGLPSEPWAFAVDRRGRIAARLEGAFSARELEGAVAKAEERSQAAAAAPR